MMRIRTAASLLCALLASTAQANESQRYAYSWPLTLNGDSSAWQIELPAEVYTVLTDTQLRDLVVVDGEGNAVPTAVRPPDSAVRVANRVELPVFMLPAGASTASPDGPLDLRIERDADGRVRSIGADLGAANPKTAPSDDYLIDASKLGAPIERLHLDWDQAVGEVNAQFSLSMSEDLQGWRTLVDKAAVLSLARDGNRLDRHDIELSRLQTKYLRLHRVDRGPALSGLRVSATVSTEINPILTAREWTPAASKDSPAGGTEYRYSMPAPLPVSAIRLNLAADNSLARLRIASRRSDADAWTTRADFTAFRLQQGDTTIVNDELAFPSRIRDTQWRIESTTPLNQVPLVNFAWQPDRFVFLAEGKGRYALAAGSAGARRADYPVDVALAQLRARLGADWQPPLARLGARETLAGDAALKPPPPASKYDWKTFLLWGVLVAAAALIGYLATSLLRGQKTSS